MFSHKLIVMAKSSTRRVILYIIGKEADASGWQVFSYEKLGEVTENIRTFAPASRTQSQTKPQANMHLTHNPSHITRNPAAEKHAFSSKERDVETGLSYFGARYYTSDLSIWLAMDPMVDKYPSLSPYVYCANNPMTLVDPNGDEIGDFFDLKGRYLGTDGHEDRNVFIVTNIRDQRIIKRNNKKELTTQPSEVDVTLSTTIDVLRETCDVYERTVNNGGDREEASTFDDNGNLIRYPTGSTTVDISVTGQVSIHSIFL